MPGIGKTRLVQLIGRVFGLLFHACSYLYLMPADVTGTNNIEKDAQGNTV
jgi:MoxR-like ATPase